MWICVARHSVGVGVDDALLTVDDALLRVDEDGLLIAGLEAAGEEDGLIDAVLVDEEELEGAKLLLEEPPLHFP